MVNFNDIVVNDIVDYKTEEELCVVKLYNQDSKASIVQEKMLEEKLASLDLGIDDITPYLEINYPKEYVLDDLYTNQDILLDVSDYRIMHKEQQL